jgi:hypothetical protein
VSALWAASFLFFLIYSAPHQVHHFFEQFPQAHHHDSDHEHPNNDRKHSPSTDTNCVFQISASRCHLGLAWQIAPALLPILVRPLPFFHTAPGGANLRPAAFHIRAPPLA